MKSELTKWKVDFKILNRMLQRGEKSEKKMKQRWREMEGRTKMVKYTFNHSSKSLIEVTAER